MLSSTDALAPAGAAGQRRLGRAQRYNPAIIEEKGLQMGSFMYGPLKMAALFRIRHFVFKICETKPATSKKPRQTQPWPGICYFGADAARVVWMEDKGKSSDTIYDGVDQGPLYSRAALDADLAAADLVIAAIRSPQVIASPQRPDDTELNEALRHVHAAVHLHTEPRQDWLRWIFDRLAQVPALPKLNSRGKLKLDHRGVSKPKCACSREQFAKTQIHGLKSPEVTLLWREHKRKHH